MLGVLRSLLWIILSSSDSRAADFSLTGGISLSTPYAGSSSSYQTAVAPEGGIRFGINGVGDVLGVEVGAFYVSESYVLTPSPGTFSFFNTSGVEIPVMIRILPFPFLALYAGGFYTLMTGASVNQNGTVSQADYLPTNFGPVAGLGVRIPVTAKSALRFDVLCNYNLSDMNNFGLFTNVLAGILIDIPEPRRHRHRSGSGGGEEEPGSGPVGWGSGD